MGYGKDLRTLIGGRLSALRGHRKLTQQQLAEALGVTQSFVNKIESGSKAVPDDQMDRLLETLAASPADLLAAERHGGPSGGDPALAREISEAVFGAHWEEVQIGVGLLHYFVKGVAEERVALLEALQGMLLARKHLMMSDMQFLGTVKAYIRKHAAKSDAEEEEMHG
jgi:transcriptional regulator with XRE-family HTH domain